MGACCRALRAAQRGARAGQPALGAHRGTVGAHGRHGRRARARRVGAVPQPGDDPQHQRLGPGLQRQLLHVPGDRLRSFHQPGAVDTARYGALSLPNTSLDSSRADALPSTLCLFLTIGHWGDNVEQPEPDTGHRKGRRKLAACFGSLERQAFSATASGYSGGPARRVHATQAVSIQRSWNRIYVGPSYSVYVTDDVAIGAALDGIGTLASSTWSVDTLVTRRAWGHDRLGVRHGDERVLDRPRRHGRRHVAHRRRPRLRCERLDAGAAPLRALRRDDRTAIERPGRKPEPVDVLGRLLGAAAGAARPWHRVGDTAPAPRGRPRRLPSAHGSGARGRADRAEPAGGQVAAGRRRSHRRRVLRLARLQLPRWREHRLHDACASAVCATHRHARREPHRTRHGLLRHRLLRGRQRAAHGARALVRVGRSIAVDPFVEPTSLALVDQHTWTAMFIIAGSASLSAFRRTLRDLGRVVRIPEGK